MVFWTSVYYGKMEWDLLKGRTKGETETLFSRRHPLGREYIIQKMIPDPRRTAESIQLQNR